MTWQDDDEFETYLRQFQLRKPKALPARRGATVYLSVAALIAVAMIVPMKMWPGTETAPEPTDAVSDTAAPTSAPAGPPVELQRPGPAAADGSASAASGLAKRIRVTRPPIRLVNVDPEYPEEAQSARIEGVVILEIVIGVDGRVIQTQVIESVPGLDQAAIDAASQWQYEPVLLNGEPVEAVMNVYINFTLR